MPAAFAALARRARNFRGAFVQKLCKVRKSNHFAYDWFGCRENNEGPLLTSRRGQNHHCVWSKHRECKAHFLRKRDLRNRSSASSAAGAKHLGHFPESGHPAGGRGPGWCCAPH